MSIVAESSAPATERAGGRGRTGRLAAAGVASLGAGAVHAVAIGVHGEHRQAVIAFTVVAAFQLGWGALALTRGHRVLAAVGIAGQLAVVAGWVVAKTSGVALVDGLGDAEPVQAADLLAAVLALLCVLAATVAQVGARWRQGRRTPAAWQRVWTLAVLALALPAMVTAAGHAHDDHGGADGHTDAHDAAAVPPTPYDPAKPIDLGGVEGVTPEQQARAENLIAVTLLRLPRFADPAAAEAAGYRTIGDGATGYEHLVNWSYIDDGRILDPDHPESLVYGTAGGRRVLQAAMFMLPPGSTLDSVPDIGGRLTQWHVHRDLCFTPDPSAPRVGGLTEGDGTCAAPLVALDPVPMIHVWITPHRCGPFAALEGIAGGQIREGEERLCDHAHGSA